MSDRIILGTRKGTIVLEKRDGRWRRVALGHAGASACFVAQDPRTGTLWACLDHGHWGPKLSRSNDGGKNWEDSPQIKFPEGARYKEFTQPDPEKGSDEKPKFKDAKLQKLWYLEFGPESQPGRIWAGTIPGGLFMSDNDGETFELNRALWDHDSRGGNLFDSDGEGNILWFGTPAAEASGDFAPGIHSITVNPNDPTHLLVAISCAGVIESKDDGKSWRSRNQGMEMDWLPNPGDQEWGHDPHFIKLCKGAPEHVWQQNHVGVYYSDNSAESWKHVSNEKQGIKFGWPIAVDNDDGKTAWIVPAKGDEERNAIDGGLFVGRTQDGGETWEQLREGLPQEDAFDTVYRHALDARGALVAFGSTTGNVYLSENRGESWLCLGNNFPPVYSVRFID